MNQQQLAKELNEALSVLCFSNALWQIGTKKATLWLWTTPRNWTTFPQFGSPWPVSKERQARPSSKSEERKTTTPNTSKDSRQQTPTSKYSREFIQNSLSLTLTSRPFWDMELSTKYSWISSGCSMQSKRRYSWLDERRTLSEWWE